MKIQRDLFRARRRVSRRPTREIYFLAVAAISLLAVQGLAEAQPSLSLENRIGVDEVNRDIEEKNTQTNGKKSFYFGFDLRSGPLEDARQYLPFLDYLGRSTGYGFKLRFTPKNSSITDDLGTGKVHFAAIGAVSFIRAHEEYGVVSLARGVNSLGKSEYQSVIVVLPESRFQSLGDLKSARLAFGAFSSTQGHLIPRIVLAENDIDLSDLAAHEYTGSHRNCANAVIKGVLDACGMQDTMANLMAREGLVRILHTSRYYPSSGIAANKDVSSDVLEKVRQALLDFDPLDRDRNDLYNWDKTEMPNGFQAAKPTDYAELRSWLARLGLLKATGVPDGGKTQE